MARLWRRQVRRLVPEPVTLEDVRFVLAAAQQDLGKCCKPDLCGQEAWEGRGGEQRTTGESRKQMNDIPDDIRPKLKRLCPAKDHPWRWRKDSEETTEGDWVLPLYKFDGTDIAACANIFPLNDGRWAVAFVSDETRVLESYLHVYVNARVTLKEAKRWVDMLIGFDSGQIPLSDPR